MEQRRRFAAPLAAYRPRRIVDLGCATGLWFEILNPLLPPQCEFIGLDSDAESLAAAAERSESWARKTTFYQCDVEADPGAVPRADLTLMFNLFPYLKDPARLLSRLAERPHRGLLAIRQYDAAAMRLGPMDAELRVAIESSLRASLLSSDEFSHYDMDRTFVVMQTSGWTIETLEFELFQRAAPYGGDFMDYFRLTIEWMVEHLSDNARAAFQRWLARHQDGSATPSYFWEVDLTAILS